MGTQYELTRRCTACGFSETSTRTVHGDFDGWSDERQLMDRNECPFCEHLRLLGRKEASRLARMLKRRKDRNGQKLKQEKSNVG